MVRKVVNYGRLVCLKHDTQIFSEGAQNNFSTGHFWSYVTLLSSSTQAGPFATFKVGKKRPLHAKNVNNQVFTGVVA